MRRQLSLVSSALTFIKTLYGSMEAILKVVFVHVNKALPEAVSFDILLCRGLISMTIVFGYLMNEFLFFFMVAFVRSGADGEALYY